MAGALASFGAAVITMAMFTRDDEPAAGIVFMVPVGAAMATATGAVLGGLIPRWKPLAAEGRDAEVGAEQ